MTPPPVCSNAWTRARQPRRGRLRSVAGAAASVVSLLLVIVAGCTGSGDAPVSRTTPANTVPATSPTSGASCVPPPRAGSDGALRRQAGTEKLWALGGTANTAQQFKIVVHMTGDGALSATAIGPDGARLAAGEIVEHPGSNFNRPGDEWRVFFSFDRPGCWQLIFTRSDIRGTIALVVRGR